MTYLEQESLEAKAQVNNEHDQGFDDYMNNKPEKQNASQQYLDGYKFAKKCKGK